MSLQKGCGSGSGTLRLETPVRRSKAFKAAPRSLPPEVPPKALRSLEQAQRVSDYTAFFLAEQGSPGYIIEHGPTDAMFDSPQDPRTLDYVNGRFG